MLPAKWFGENTPILDQILNCQAAGWVIAQSLLDYVKSQARINSSYGNWLDFTSNDYFGSRLRRRSLEDDNRFRKRILFDLRRERCTRFALHDTLHFLTGKTPFIFEPARPSDTGCYGLAGNNGHGIAGYGTSGRWGSLSLPFQVFIKVQKLPVQGIGMVNGWCETMGAYGIGQISYTCRDDTDTAVTDTEIYDAIRYTLPAGSIAWVAIDP